MPIQDLNIFAAPVLAGAYKARKWTKDEDKSLLLHAVVENPINIGRLKREHGEAFCNRKINTADYFTWVDSIDAITCPRCQSIVQRLMNRL